MAAAFLLIGAVAMVVGVYFWIAPGAALFLFGVLCAAVGVDLAGPRPNAIQPERDRTAP